MREGNEDGSALAEDATAIAESRGVAEADGSAAHRKSKRRARRAIGVGIVLRLSLAGLLFGLLFLMLTGQPLPVPQSVMARVEEGASARLGPGRFELGGIQLALGRDGKPRVQVEGIRVSGEGGGASAALNRVVARISASQLLRGKLVVREIVLDGAQITLKRRADGRFGDATQSGETQALPELLDKVESAFARGGLAGLSRIEARNVVLSLEDARSGRVWQATDARATLRHETGGIGVSITSDLFNGTDALGELQISASRSRQNGRTSLGITVDGVRARDIALQTPALAFLSVLKAPISGSVRAELTDDGSLTSLAGTLDLDEGVLQPAPDVAPVPFQSAHAYFSFDPKRERIDFSDVSFQSATASLSGAGHAYLSEFERDWPNAFLGQFRVSEARYAGEGLFPEPVIVDDLRADLRLRLAPFSIEFGQIAAIAEPAPVIARGRIDTGDGGWRMSLDAQTARIAPGVVLAHWPERVARGTRNWLAQNVLGGTLTDVSTHVRARTGAKPELSLSFGIEDGDVRFMPDLPPIEDAVGYGILADDRFTIVVDEGWITAPERGARIDTGGSVFQVTNTRQKPAPARIQIAATGPISSVLEVMDRRPFRIMERAGRTPDLAEGIARIEADVVLPLKNGMSPEDVDYTVAGEVLDVRSENLVEGRTVEAERLALSVTPDLIRVTGPARLEGVPLTADWRKPLGDGAPPAELTGTIRLSRENAEALGVPLPSGLLSGEGRGTYRVAFDAVAPPTLTLSSDMRGIGMAIDGIGWSKGRDASGAFEMTAILGEAPRVPSLSLDAPGLSASGALSLGPGGRFEGATFDRVVAGGWLDAAVRLTARADATPAIALTGGRFDLRRFNRGRTGRGGGAPIDIALDRVTISEAISLTDVRGRLVPASGGLSGDVTGRLGGRTQVSARLTPAAGGTAIRVRSEDAGGAVRDAGLTPNARGGTLDLVLAPVEGARSGTYDGQFVARGVRLRKAPAMADLLDAISVVGLLDQLDGPGIAFDSVDGRFRMTPERITLQRAAAVGGSMGISADGIFDLGSRQMDVRGVISPVYFLNGIGAIFTRRGEGLFGFNYRMAGAMSEPAVNVNPLSILTPGMFREIFRSNPPEG